MPIIKAKRSEPIGAAVGNVAASELVNARGADVQKDDSQTTAASDDSSDQAAPAPASSVDGHDAQGKSYVGNTLLLLAGLLLPVAVYFVLTALSGAKQQDSHEIVQQSIDVVPDVNIYEKTASLASLARKEFELNFVALTEAQKDPDSVTYTSLEIILDKNRKDLAKYKEQLVEILLIIYDLYQIGSPSVQAEISSRLVSAEAANRNEQMKHLELLQKILDGTPANVNLPTYFKAAIDDSI